MDISKILIVVEDEEWKNALINCLSNEKSIQFIQVAKTVEQALQNYLLVDLIIITDYINNTKYDSLELARQMCEAAPTNIIILSPNCNPEYIIKSFRSGAINFLPRDRYEQLPHLIRTIASNSDTIKILISDYLELCNQLRLKELTESERLVYNFLIDGYTIKSISSITFKSESTIKNQINSIYKKLNVNSRRQLLSAF